MNATRDSSACWVGAMAGCRRARLIEAGKDDFDIDIAQSVYRLADQVQRQRSVGIKSARKILTDLLQPEVKAK